METRFMLRIPPHTTVPSRAEQAASEAMQKLILSTNFALHNDDGSPRFADLYCLIAEKGERATTSQRATARQAP